MSFLRNLDIKPKILASTLGIVFVTTLVIDVAIFAMQYHTAKTNLDARLNIEANIISQNISASVLFDDEKTTSEILSSFKSDPAILKVEVLDLAEKVFSEHVTKDGYIVGGADFSISKPIVFSGDEIGTLVVYVSDAEISSGISKTILFSITTLVIALGVAFLLSLAVQGMIFESILALHNTSQRVAKTRDYSLRAEIFSEDEIGRLAKTFNSMLEQVEQRDAMLEKQVSHRTLELEKLAEEFRFRAFHDNLTGLPNRALLNERFGLCIEHARRCGNKFVCLLLDLDDFKTINDTKGHDYGDELLIGVAQRLKASVRAEDLVCRLGGDEFIILATDIETEFDARQIANNILFSLSEDIVIKDDKIKTAVSIGGAIYPQHGETVGVLKRHADVAMYHAKDGGKNRFSLFSHGMQEEVHYRLMIQRDLEPAILDNQLIIYFQPKVLAETGEVAGCEALVRWQHPEEGFLTPDKFIPYAEETPLIREIDYYVIRECCKKLKEWSARFDKPVPIAVNLSGRHFRSFKIVEVLKEAITSAGISPDLLEIEITEAVLIADPDKAQKVVHAIKSIGFTISLDDFGTGYSSLNYLRTLPIDIIKLDRSFIANIDTSEQDRRLTRGITSLAKGLDLTMVAEGVETESQLQTLLDLGCHCFQGYYFSKPVPEVEFLAWHKKYNNALGNKHKVG